MLKGGWVKRRGYSLGGFWLKIKKRGAHTFPYSLDLCRLKYFTWWVLHRTRGGWYFNSGLLLVRFGLNSL